MISFAERQIGKYCPEAGSSNNQRLGVNAQAGLDSIVARKIWATMCKLSAPRLAGVVVAA
eukprot:1565503-Pyramimonas_sp.AAC.1